VVRYWIDVFTVHILICWSVSKFAFQYTVFADEYYFIYFLYYFSISIMDEITSLISILLLCCEKGAEIGLSKWKYIVGVRTDQTAVPLIPYRCNIREFHLQFLLFNLDRGIISRHFDFDSTMCKIIKGKCRWYMFRNRRSNRGRDWRKSLTLCLLCGIPYSSPFLQILRKMFSCNVQNKNVFI